MLNKFIKTHLCKVFNKLCKVCATAALIALVITKIMFSFLYWVVLQNA